MPNVSFGCGGDPGAVLDTVLVVMILVGIAFTVYVWLRILRDR